MRGALRKFHQDRYQLSQGGLHPARGTEELHKQGHHGREKLYVHEPRVRAREMLPKVSLIFREGGFAQG